MEARQQTAAKPRLVPCQGRVVATSDSHTRRQSLVPTNDDTLTCALSIFYAVHAQQQKSFQLVYMLLIIGLYTLQPKCLTALRYEKIRVFYINTHIFI
jgi:hypothetical protein